MDAGGVGCDLGFGYRRSAAAARIPTMEVVVETIDALES
jgi:hypothetical protein